MTDDYKPRSTHHKWIAGGITGAMAGFFPMMGAIIILNEMDLYHDSGVLLLALACGSFGGAIMRHAND